MEEIYTAYALPVKKYVMTLCGSSALADDITAETFLKAVKNIDSFHSGRMLTWLCAIAKNKNASRRLLGVKFWCLILCFLHKQLPKQSNHI